MINIKQIDDNHVEIDGKLFVSANVKDGIYINSPGMCVIGNVVKPPTPQLNEIERLTIENTEAGYETFPADGRDKELGWDYECIILGGSDSCWVELGSARISDCIEGWLYRRYRTPFKGITGPGIYVTSSGREISLSTVVSNRSGRCASGVHWATKDFVSCKKFFTKDELWNICNGEVE